MRKECKRRKSVYIASVQGYHAGGSWGSEQYAFQGFSGNWYFNSDRKIALDSEYRRTDGQDLLGFGLEIETECRGIRNGRVLADVYDKIIFPAFKFGSSMFKMQSDCSLGGDTSAEVITQVMTKSRIRNDYAAYRTMFDEYFPAFRISADSYNTNCGMHVNVSNGIFGKTEEQQIEAIRKLYYIVNKHYTLMCKLFYRSPERTRYCGKMDYSCAKTLDFSRCANDHGASMNLSHFRAGRIEIRLVGGQRDYYCFRNTMESVFFLCDRVKSISWKDCDNIPELFKGCNQYVIKRLADCGLSSEDMQSIKDNCKPEDLELRH